MQDVSFFFGDRRCPSANALTATFDSSTLCVIKPHAVRAGKTGDIITEILKQGFEISACQQFTRDKAAAEEFLEVYRGVVKEYGVRGGHRCKGWGGG